MINSAVNRKRARDLRDEINHYESEIGLIRHDLKKEQDAQLRETLENQIREKSGIVESMKNQLSRFEIGSKRSYVG